ncbi:MAG: GDP-mannose 4,6-dehydratase, partial [Candidatus Lindowbacteria bacterium]|nr:GDP-mannose 4,6-dehydratase [Candidatus Lindowbacteria bacterium]
DLSTGSRDNIDHLRHDPSFEFCLGTVMDFDTVDKLVSRSEIVFHMAAAVGVKYVIENPLASLRINTKGAENVFESSNRYKRKLILASTSEIYGKNEKERLSEDDDRVLGSTTISRWGYACTKAFDEFLALAYWREKKLPVVILRFFNTCGPRQSGEYGMVVPRFVKAALLGHPLRVFGDGKQIRCFSFVDDIVEGTIALAEHPAAVGEIFNLGSMEPVTIEELAQKIITITDSSSPIHYIPYEQAYEKGFEDLRRRVPDTSKAKRVVGFEPKTSLDELLRKVIDYFER